VDSEGCLGSQICRGWGWDVVAFGWGCITGWLVSAFWMDMDDCGEMETWHEMGIYVLCMLACKCACLLCMHGPDSSRYKQRPRSSAGVKDSGTKAGHQTRTVTGLLEGEREDLGLLVAHRWWSCSTAATRRGSWSRGVGDVTARRDASTTSSHERRRSWCVRGRRKG